MTRNGPPLQKIFLRCQNTVGLFYSTLFYSKRKTNNDNYVIAKRKCILSLPDLASIFLSLTSNQYRYSLEQQE